MYDYSFFKCFIRIYQTLMLLEVIYAYPSWECRELGGGARIEPWVMKRD